MDKPVRAPGYDLFKLIVAILLLLLFLIFFARGNPSSPVSTPVPTNMALSTTTAFLQSSATPTLLITSIPTVSGQPSMTATPMPSATETRASQLTSTATSEPTPTAGGPVSSNACDDAMSRSRLKVGVTATILRRLNFRSSPGIQNNWVLTHRPGTKAEVVGGPVCVPFYVGVYVWWQIKLPDGQVGWSAEASLFGKFYFMEPSQ